MTQRFKAEQCFFTSDTHFFHRSIIAACNRPFHDLEHMREEMKRVWNEFVPPEGIVFHLGDVSLGNNAQTAQYLSELNGTKHLIEGNHDKNLPTWLKEACFASHQPLLEIDVEEGGGTLTRITLCHYALRTWNRHHFGAWQLHGHSHGHLAPIGRQMDVGVDANGYVPLKFEWIKEKLAKVPIHVVDQHKPE